MSHKDSFKGIGLEEDDSIASGSFLHEMHSSPSWQDNPSAILLASKQKPPKANNNEGRQRGNDTAYHMVRMVFQDPSHFLGTPKALPDMPQQCFIYSEPQLIKEGESPQKATTSPDSIVQSTAIKSEMVESPNRQDSAEKVPNPYNVSFNKKKSNVSTIKPELIYGVKRDFNEDIKVEPDIKEEIFLEGYEDYYMMRNKENSYVMQQYEGESGMMESNRPARYKMLSSSQKAEIVEESYRTSLALAAKKHQVSVNNICRWRKRCERKSGAGRKVHDPSMEDRLVSWIRQYPNLTRQAIRVQAKLLSRDPTFKASKGWYERFISRHKFIRLGAELQAKPESQGKKEPKTEMNSEEPFLCE